MVVIGAGATGVQLASIFNALGSGVTLVEVAPRILMTEDPDVAAAVATALQETGISVIEAAGAIRRFESCDAGVRAVFGADGEERPQEAALVVVAVGWQASTAGLALEHAGVELDDRGFVRVDSELRTTAAHIFAAGDVNGGVLVAHEATREGYLAASYAVTGHAPGLPAEVCPIGSYTDPEYASVGLTEENARERHKVVVGIERLDSLPRAIIDDRTTGFCKSPTTWHPRRRQLARSTTSLQKPNVRPSMIARTTPSKGIIVVTTSWVSRALASVSPTARYSRMGEAAGGAEQMRQRVGGALDGVGGRHEAVLDRPGDQHQASGHVAGGIDVRRGCLEKSIHLDGPVRLEHNPRCREIQVGGIGHRAHGHDRQLRLGSAVAAALR